MKFSWMITCLKWFSAILLVVYLSGAYILQLPIMKRVFVHQVEHVLLNEFGCSVRIGAIQGTIFSSVQLEDLQISVDQEHDSFFKADQVTLYFSLPHLALSWSLGQSLQQLDVDGVDVRLIREQDGTWNIPFDSRFTVDSGAFKKVNMMNVRGRFLDKKGLNHAQVGIDQLFNNGVVNIEADAENRIQVSFTSGLNDDLATVDVSGVIDFGQGGCVFKILVQDLDTRLWGPYILPFRDIRLYDDRVSFEANFSHQFDYDYPRVPFSYEVLVHVDALDVDLPYIELPMKSVNGQVVINNYMEDNILYFRSVTATIDDIPIYGDGHINLNLRTIDVDIYSDELVSIKTVSTIFPRIVLPYIDTDIQLEIALEGRLIQPKVNARVRSNSVKFQGVDLGMLDAGINFDGKLINIESSSSSNITINGWIDSSNLDLVVYIPNYVIGSQLPPIAMHLNVTGNVSTLHLNLLCSDVAFENFGFGLDQVVAQLSFDMTTQQVRLHQLESRLSNGQSVFWGGMIDLDTQQVNLTTQSLQLNDGRLDYQGATLASIDGAFVLFRENDQWKWTGLVSLKESV